ncbi:hypothetical protein BDP55DRAFT_710195 [Colletotrichum godetiae]|uniref:CBM1 domain-containing protein n=1 Tax=Colletotrichum godetiae TaxID=1209918 RepID=A0AAJ0AZB4_9PEZI|nr:uncharacterized protein BDP55DRAFT_710195 [Colletotrichum godetiae]KAK1700586.1 hypothetical protein BDP55DRAFT_710195 [Colletotrichum godetiae]
MYSVNLLTATLLATSMVLAKLTTNTVTRRFRFRDIRKANLTGPKHVNIPKATSLRPLAAITTAPTSSTTPPRRAIVTVTVSSWTTQIITRTQIDTVIETITVWVPPSTTISTVRSTSSSSVASSSRSASVTTPPVSEPTQSKYGQCGGSSYVGATRCAAGSTCSVLNQWYYQCL